MKEIRYEAEWWVPGSEDRRWGVLAWFPEQPARLELVGRLTDERENRIGGVAPRTIYGRTRSGELMTLLDNQIVGSSWDPADSGPRAQVISSMAVLTGGHLPDGDVTPVESIRMGSPVVDWWLEMDPFESEQIDQTDHRKSTLTYRHPDPIELELPDGQLVFESIVAPSTWIGGRKLDVHTWITVQRGSPAPLSEYWDRSIGSVFTYLTFATSRPWKPTYVGVKFIGEAHELTLLSPGVSHVEDQEPTYFTSDAPITRYTVGGRLHELMGRWLATSVDKQGLRDAYLALLSGPPLFSETRFLLLVTGLEAFWRSDLRRLDIPANEHAARTAAILASCPIPHREWLRERLQHSNEPPQRVRLEEVCNRAWPGLFARMRNPAAFVRTVVATRNFLVHGDQARARHAERNPVRLYRLSMILELLAEMAILDQLGVTSEDRENILRKYLKFRNVDDRIRALGV